MVTIITHQRDYQISYAVLEKEIADFLINDAQCSFSGTKVINFNGGIPDRTTARNQRTGNGQAHRFLW